MSASSRRSSSRTTRSTSRAQYHPEFKSRPERPAPLFDGFISAALAHGGSPVASRLTTEQSA